MILKHKGSLAYFIKACPKCLNWNRGQQTFSGKD